MALASNKALAATKFEKDVFVYGEKPCMAYISSSVQQVPGTCVHSFHSIQEVLCRLLTWPDRRQSAAHIADSTGRKII